MPHKAFMENQFRAITLLSREPSPQQSLIFPLLALNFTTGHLWVGREIQWDNDATFNFGLQSVLPLDCHVYSLPVLI